MGDHRLVPNLSPKCKLLLPYLLFIPSTSTFQSWTIWYHVLLRRVSISQKVVFYVMGGKRPGGNLTGGGGKRRGREGNDRGGGGASGGKAPGGKPPDTVSCICTNKVNYSSIVGGSSVRFIRPT